MWKGASAGLPTGQSSLLGQPLRKYMVRAEPPTPERPAAPGPVCHTQRPRAGRPPPTPPPAQSAAAATAASRGICPLAGPGQADAMLRDEGTPAQTGLRVAKGRGGRVRPGEGGRSAGARPGPAPSSGRAGVTTPRRVGRRGGRARARSGDVCHLPHTSLLKPRPKFHRRPPRSVNAHAVWFYSCLFLPRVIRPG